jgi:hypothetical protein
MNRKSIFPVAVLAIVSVAGSAMAQDWYHRRERSFAGERACAAVFRRFGATWSTSTKRSFPAIARSWRMMSRDYTNFNARRPGIGT